MDRIDRIMLRAFVVIAVLLVAVAALLPTEADAQTRWCGPWETLRTFLEKRFGEVPIGRGLADSRHAIIVLADPERSGFTIVKVRTDGLACVLDGGSGWEDLTPPIAGDDT